MKAIILNKTGNAKDVLSIIDTSIPICKKNEVLIRMIKSSINPADILFIAGAYRHKPTLRQTPGFEGVGVIEDANLNNNLRKGS